MWAAFSHWSKKHSLPRLYNSSLIQAISSILHSGEGWLTSQHFRMTPSFTDKSNPKPRQHSKPKTASFHLTRALIQLLHPNSQCLQSSHYPPNKKQPKSAQLFPKFYYFHSPMRIFHLIPNFLFWILEAPWHKWRNEYHCQHPTKGKSGPVRFFFSICSIGMPLWWSAKIQFVHPIIPFPIPIPSCSCLPRMPCWSARCSPLTSWWQSATPDCGPINHLCWSRNSQPQPHNAQKTLKWSTFLTAPSTWRPCCKTQRSESWCCFQQWDTVSAKEERGRGEKPI